ncbi:DUF2950 domain-containing protein [Paraburkholderia dioscoreae]|uniref:DUF2950 domain-containing protein n=1 Tax=Paraburkholderia dioscoreae TaxID=2604047 RepID=A0A5Q4ZDD0_9BURK|nr:DUF2950 domain-containing protein [Paraburkholderia dioscoreae]VVD28661.1 conserved exported protein of unknown function [Paraburkholderia dioscoreae]
MTRIRTFQTFGARLADTLAHALACAPKPRLAGTALGLAALLLGASAAHAQAVYPTPEAASKAFVDALSSNDNAAMQHVLGKDFTRFIPTKNVGEDDIYEFLGAWAAGHQIVDDPAPLNGHASKHLSVGTSGWTLPIPLVQTSGGWRFDPAAGRDEIMTRRIGRNERAAMLTSLAYLDAQHDYRELTQHYAQRILSTPGQHDGLYWQSAPGEPESPLGPLAAAMPHTGSVAKEGYHGYHFRILSAQGPHAKGGSQNYVEKGTMTKGFGLVAWPAEYGRTGVMSFIVNQDGLVYQKNLGPQSARIAAGLKSFDPDSSWEAVQP